MSPRYKHVFEVETNLPAVDVKRALESDNVTTRVTHAATEPAAAPVPNWQPGDVISVTLDPKGRQYTFVYGRYHWVRDGKNGSAEFDARIDNLWQKGRVTWLIHDGQPVTNEAGRVGRDAFSREPAPMDGVKAAIIELCRSGKKFMALKLYREATGAPLEPARSLINRVERQVQRREHIDWELRPGASGDNRPEPVCMVPDCGCTGYAHP